MKSSIVETLQNQYSVKLGRRLGRDDFAETLEGQVGKWVCQIRVSHRAFDASEEWVNAEMARLERIRSLPTHPNVLPLRAVWLIDGHLVTSRQSYEKTLADRLRECKERSLPGIPEEELLGYLHEAARAIDFLNGHGIQHADIRPENLLLVDGHVKLVGAGLARFVDAATGCLSQAESKGYNPPETTVDAIPATCDLYALAAMFVLLRSSQEPFGTNEADVSDRKQMGRPVFYGLETDEFSAVGRAVSYNAEDRPSDGAVAWATTVGEPPVVEPEEVATPEPEPETPRPSALFEEPAGKVTPKPNEPKPRKQPAPVVKPPEAKKPPRAKKPKPAEEQIVDATVVPQRPQGNQPVRWTPRAPSSRGQARYPKQSNQPEGCGISLLALLVFSLGSLFAIVAMVS